MAEARRDAGSDRGGRHPQKSTSVVGRAAQCDASDTLRGVDPKHARSPERYIALLEEPRKSEIRRLHELIRRAAPGLEPHMQSGMIGYGRYHYRYASGREGDWSRISLASQKNYISLYVMATKDGRYLAETYAERLPRANIGRSCASWNTPTWA
jgi:hypothetical protein